MSGRRDEATGILNNLLEQAKHHYISSYYIATIFAGLNDKEQALAWLERACSDRNEWLVWLKVDDRFECLWKDSRFSELLKRIGFSHGASEGRARSRLAVLPPDNIGNDSNFYVARSLLGLAYLEKGLFEEAITELQKTQTITDNREASALLGYAFAVSGRRDEARQTLAELRRAAQQKYVDPVLIAVIHIGLKETDQAFASLEKAFENRSVWLALLNVSPLFESLRSDPRFTNLLRRVEQAN